MKTVLKKYSILFIGLVLLNMVGYSQTLTDTLTDQNEFVGIIELPPLHELIDSAYAYSPLISFQNLTSDKQELLIEIEKKLWLDGVKLNSNYNWGTNNAMVQGTLLPQSFSTTAQNWYGVGASVSMQLSTILNRKESIQVRELEYKISKEKEEEFKQSLRKAITELYLKTGLKAEVLKLSNEAVVVSEISYKYAEIELENNSIEILDYSKVHAETVKAKIFYQEAKQAYMLSLNMLEEVTGVKIRN